MKKVIVVFAAANILGGCATWDDTGAGGTGSDTEATTGTGSRDAIYGAPGRTGQDSLNDRQRGPGIGTATGAERGAETGTRGSGGAGTGLGSGGETNTDAGR